MSTYLGAECEFCGGVTEHEENCILFEEEEKKP